MTRSISKKFGNSEMNLCFSPIFFGLGIHLDSHLPQTYTYKYNLHCFRVDLFCIRFWWHIYRDLEESDFL